MGFLCGQLAVLVVDLSDSGLKVPIVVKMTYLVERGHAFLELISEQVALGFKRQDVQAVAGKASTDLFSDADTLEYFAHRAVIL